MSNEQKQIVLPEERKPARIQPQAGQITPLDMINNAVQRGASMEQLKELLDLQERWEANEARKAYAAAMAAFHADPPEVYKNKLVSFKNSDGSTTSYRHSTLDNLANAVSEKMAPHGLSFRWNPRREGDRVFVTCVIQHELGHSEQVTLECGLDTSGKKNPIQQMGSAVKYLERYTLEAAAGVASEDPETDDDGRKTEEPPPGPVVISNEQYENMIALITEVGTTAETFAKICKVDDLKNLPAAKYKGAMQKLEAKRAQA